MKRFKYCDLHLWVMDAIQTPAIALHWEKPKYASRSLSRFRFSLYFYFLPIGFCISFWRFSEEQIRRNEERYNEIDKLSTV